MRVDWLRDFKKTVVKARDCRVAGDIQEACLWDRAIEGYYRENKVNEYFDEDSLFDIESDLRKERPL